jgi:S-adenosylmethionine/arginine decarboxylase-like enzyme
MIETSHIAFHIWDEQNPGLLQFDLYTCSSLDVSLVLDELETFFDFEEYQYMVFDREHNFQLIDGSFSSYGDYDYGF